MNVARQLYQVGLGFLGILGLAVGLAACTAGPDTEPFTSTGSVIVSISPDDANVSLIALDEEGSNLTAQGLAPQQTGASLHYLKPPGDYLLTVSRDGYETQDRFFTLQASELRYFDIYLEPEGGLPPDPDPYPEPNPDPDQEPVELTLTGTATDWNPDYGGHLSFTGALYIVEDFDETEVFFEEPVFPTTISDAGAFEVTLTEPAEDVLFYDYFCDLNFYASYVSFAGVSSAAYPELGTVSGILGQFSLQDPLEPSVGDVVVGAIYFDRDVRVSCDDFGFKVDIDAQKGWNTVVQTVTGIDEDGFPEIEITTGPAPAEAQWTFFSLEEVIGSPQLSTMAQSIFKR